MDNFPTRKGPPTGRGNERQMMAETDVGGFRKRYRTNADGSTTTLKTRGGWPQFTTEGSKVDYYEEITIYPFRCLIADDTDKMGVDVSSTGKPSLQAVSWEATGFTEIKTNIADTGVALQSKDTLANHPGTVDWTLTTNVPGGKNHEKNPLKVSWGMPHASRTAFPLSGPIDNGFVVWHIPRDSAQATAAPGYIGSYEAGSNPTKDAQRLGLPSGGIVKVTVNGKIVTVEGLYENLYGAFVTYSEEGARFLNLVTRGSFYPGSSTGWTHLFIRKYAFPIGTSLVTTFLSMTQVLLRGLDKGFGTITDYLVTTPVFANQDGTKITFVAQLFLSDFPDNYSGFNFQPAVAEVNVETGETTFPLEFGTGFTNAPWVAGTDFETTLWKRIPVAADYAIDGSLLYLIYEKEWRIKLSGWQKDVAAQPDPAPGRYTSAESAWPAVRLIDQDDDAWFLLGSADIASRMTETEVSTYTPYVGDSRNYTETWSYDSLVSDHSLSLYDVDLRTKTAAGVIVSMTVDGEYVLRTNEAVSPDPSVETDTLTYSTKAFGFVVHGGSTAYTSSYGGTISSGSGILGLVLPGDMRFPPTIAEVVSGGEGAGPDSPFHYDDRKVGWTWHEHARPLRDAEDGDIPVKDAWPLAAAIARSPDGNVVFIEFLDKGANAKYRAIWRRDPTSGTWSETESDNVLSAGVDSAVYQPVFLTPERVFK